MTAHRPIRGLYALTPEMADTQALLRKIELALIGGARLLQYRHKQASAELAQSQALALRELTTRYGARLIINDHVDLAIAVNADGVHLGRGDGDVCAIKAAHPDLMVGVSCYNDLARAEIVARDGADYLAFGSFFPSRIKPNAVAASAQLIAEAKRRFAAPVVAIGGISLVTAPLLIEQGVDAVAVISALFEASDIQLVAQQFTNLFNRGHDV